MVLGLVMESPVLWGDSRWKHGHVQRTSQPNTAEKRSLTATVPVLPLILLPFLFSSPSAVVAGRREPVGELKQGGFGQLCGSIGAHHELWPSMCSAPAGLEPPGSDPAQQLLEPQLAPNPSLSQGMHEAGSSPPAQAPWAASPPSVPHVPVRRAAEGAPQHLGAPFWGCSRSMLSAVSSKINELIRLQVVISSHCLKGLELDQGQYFVSAARSCGVLELPWCRCLSWRDTKVFLPSFAPRASVFPGWIYASA